MQYAYLTPEEFRTMESGGFFSGLKFSAEGIKLFAMPDGTVVVYVDGKGAVEIQFSEVK